MSATTILRVTRMTARAEGPRLLVPLALPILAFAAATALALTVIGGHGAFAGRDDRPDAEFYLTLASIASILVVIPCVTLGLAAARLGARKRDARLASMRLAGATPGDAAGMAMAEASIAGLLGALLGAGINAALLPVVALLPFQGEPFSIGELWVGPWILLASILGVPVLAAATSLLGLRSIAITPLGVAQRHAPPPRGLILLVVSGGGLLLWTQASPAAAGITGLLIALAITFAMLNVVGPRIVALVGRAMLARAGDAASLIAARRVLDAPAQAWRTVSGVAVASFVAAGTALLTAIGSGNGEEQLMSDLRLGVAFTLVATFALAAISTALTQAAAILEHRELYVSLHHAGTPVAVMQAARSRQARGPVLVLSVVSAGAALAFLFPITGAVVLLDPLALGQVVMLLALGNAIVIGGVLATRPLLRRVVTAD
ncbi:FtsX-like permease family protein [Lolliginicoccus suaedae]|uniref:FtsX-like permease family protein n=1 Tax=Lolliginicoccus suaedae TaxID=2605429 RepID=UPI0011EF3F82|nr:FtsX-like permease family protein [Lolliginicoccus suaedae]